MDLFKDIEEKQRPNYLDQLENKYNQFRELHQGKYTEEYLKEQLDKVRIEINDKIWKYERNLKNLIDQFRKNRRIEYTSSDDIDPHALSDFKYNMTLKGYNIKETHHQKHISDFMDGMITRTTTIIYIN